MFKSMSEAKLLHWSKIEKYLASRWNNVVLEVQMEEKKPKNFKCGQKGHIRAECDPAKKGQSSTKVEEQSKIQTSVITPTLVPSPPPMALKPPLTSIYTNKYTYSSNCVSTQVPKPCMHQSPQQQQKYLPPQRQWHLITKVQLFQTTT